MVNFSLEYTVHLGVLGWSVIMNSVEVSRMRVEINILANLFERPELYFRLEATQVEINKFELRFETKYEKTKSSS